MSEYEPKPCSCGIKHKKDDGNYEFYDMKMTADHSPFQLPPRRTARCKFCKEVLILERKPTDEEKLKLDKSTLEDIFLKKSHVPSSFNITWI